jgi:hypothetical protein
LAARQKDLGKSKRKVIILETKIKKLKNFLFLLMILKLLKISKKNS